MWFWTLNNYTEEDVQRIKLLKCKYMCFGKEIGKKCGTPHLQGMSNSFDAKTLSAFKKWMGSDKVHAEPLRSIKEAMDYCRKDGIYYESGVRPMTKEEQGRKGKEFWDHQLHLSKTGRIDMCDSEVQIKYGGRLDKIWAKEQSKYRLRDVETKHIWLWGETGSGKSRPVRERYPLLFDKGFDKWWDHYNGEEVVLIEEVHPSHGKDMVTFFKRWMDRYSFKAEGKGVGAVAIRPKLVVLTSNYRLDNVWVDDRELRPLRRRLEEIEVIEGQDPNINWPLPPQIDERPYLEDMRKVWAAESEPVHVDLLDAPVEVVDVEEPESKRHHGLDALAEAAADLPKDDPEYVFENVDYLFDDLDERTSDDGSQYTD